MTKEEIQASIKSIMFSGSVCGIEIYACLRDESGYQTKKIRATDKLLSSTKDKVAGFINCTYLADHIVISSQKEAAAFIKMLNDDIVRSELTGKEYDSSSKMLLGPVGASH